MSFGVDLDVHRPHDSHVSTLCLVRVKDKRVTRRADIGTTWRVKQVAVATSNQQGLLALGERARAEVTLEPGIARIVARASIAVGAEEEEVRVINPRQRWRLDEWAVGRIAVQDLFRRPLWSNTVCLHLLQHDRRGNNWIDTVATISAVTNAVAVDFVDNPNTAVLVDES